MSHSCRGLHHDLPAVHTNRRPSPLKEASLRSVTAALSPPARLFAPLLPLCPSALCLPQQQRRLRAPRRALQAAQWELGAGRLGRQPRTFASPRMWVARPTRALVSTQCLAGLRGRRQGRLSSAASQRIALTLRCTSAQLPTLLTRVSSNMYQACSQPWPQQLVPCISHALVMR